MDLSFTVPTLSTDRQPLAGRHGAGPLTAELCRRATASAPCLPVHTQPVAPGESAHIQDSLPSALTAGNAVRLQYSVRIRNAQGNSAANAREAVSAAGAAPAAMQALAATTTDRGVQLTWRAAPADPSVSIQIGAKDGSHQRNLTVSGDPGGVIDTSPAPGNTVTYTVLRSHTLAGTPPTTLSGEPGTVTITRAADTFAPAVPLGLVAVAVQIEQAQPEIDLSWEPNTEPDLAGYLVDRTDAARPAQAVLLTPSPIAAVSYRDRTAILGHTYRYTVRAQDGSGNRSARSAPATESLRP